MRHSDRANRRAGALLVAGGAALWGTLGVAARSAFAAGVTPAQAAFWRTAIAFIVLLAIAAAGRFRMRPVPVRDLPLFVAYGLIGVALFMTVYFEAIRLTSVATAVMLLYTAPAWVTVLARLFLGEPLTREKAAAVALVFAGSALVVRAYDPIALRLNPAGTVAGLAAGLTYALYSIFGKRALRRHGPLTTLLYPLGVAAIALWVIARPALRVPAAAVPTLLYLALVGTLLAYALYINGLKRIDAGRASILATVEPVVAALLSVWLLGERLEPAQWAGAALILAGVVVIARGTAVPPAPPRELSAAPAGSGGAPPGAPRIPAHRPGAGAADPARSDGGAPPG